VKDDYETEKEARTLKGLEEPLKTKNIGPSSEVIAKTIKELLYAC
jgi:hypothetical protein